MDNLCISTFKIEHDAKEPFGLALQSKRWKFSIVTDLGSVNEHIFKYCNNSHVLIFESNYDEDMLLNGTYPYFLKQRIIGIKGHLSNKDAATALRKLNWGGLGRIYLAHMSRKNNIPEKAIQMVKNAFRDCREIPEILPIWNAPLSSDRFLGFTPFQREINQAFYKHSKTTIIEETQHTETNILFKPLHLKDFFILSIVIIIEFLLILYLFLL
jgi:hypothetical protein